MIPITNHASIKPRGPYSPMQNGASVQSHKAMSTVAVIGCRHFLWDHPHKQQFQVTNGYIDLCATPSWTSQMSCTLNCLHEHCLKYRSNLKQCDQLSATEIYSPIVHQLKIICYKLNTYLSNYIQKCNNILQTSRHQSCFRP
jgi:hypothetical protein